MITGPMPPDGRLRCPWALSATEYLAYHDNEWRAISPESIAMARAPQGPRLPLLRPDHGVRDDAGLTILLSARADP
jgi:hypothetical protein